MFVEDSESDREQRLLEIDKSFVRLVESDDKLYISLRVYMKLRCCLSSAKRVVWGFAIKTRKCIQRNRKNEISSNFRVFKQDCGVILKSQSSPFV